MKKVKKFICLLMICIMALNMGTLNIFADGSDINDYPRMLDTLRNCRDLSNFDFSNEIELLSNINFTDTVIWPTKDKLPNGFNPTELIEYGKEPGLGIKSLHEKGLTGKGVSIAYIDQPLTSHEAYDNVDLHYTIIEYEGSNITLESNSMHGPAVLSLLAGKDIGVAPDSTVYYYATAPWLGDQKVHAKALYQIVEDNKKLDDDDKIKIVGFSDNIDESEDNPDALREAVEYAENNGVIVFFCFDPMEELTPIRSKIKTDKENYKNYETVKWYNSPLITFGVPTGSRTVANCENSSSYTYYTNGGVSWATPYMVGLAALGLQINPNLTKDEIVSYFKESAALTNNVINPEGFIELVRKNSPKDYYYFLYNKNEVTDKDYTALEEYINQFDQNTEKIIIDASSYKSAQNIYEYIKDDSKDKKGRLLGIQIIGSSEEVPAFNVHYKVNTVTGIDEGDYFLSDYFYSNFESTDLDKEISVYASAEEGLGLSFIPNWPVARLPLGKGEIEKYFDKYKKYKNVTKDKILPIIDFSSPIFDSKVHSDDTGVLLTHMEELNLIDKKDYRLYGNLLGKYPVETQVLGDFSKESLKLENEKGIMNLNINSHGQWNNIDQYILSDDHNAFKDEARLQYLNDKNEMVTRLSLININTINTTLNENYYNIFSRSCLNAYNLNKENLFHKGLADGLLVNAIGNSSIGANNGFDVYRELDDLKNNNSAYNYMVYVYSLARGNTISDSYYKAKKAYAKEVLKNSSLGDDESHGNQQYQLHNILSQNYLGVLDYDKGSNINLSSLEDTIEKNFIASKFYGDFDLSKIPYVSKNQEELIAFEEDNIDYASIPYDITISNNEKELKEVSAGVDDTNIYLKIKYNSNIEDYIFIFLQGDAPGLSQKYDNGTKKGENTLIIKLNKDDVKGYEEGLAINLGSRNFVWIDKGLMDSICLVRVK